MSADDQLMSPAELAAVRGEFPALAATMANPCIYMDNAGGAQVLKRVADKVTDYLLSTSVQLGGSYATAVSAHDRVLGARRTIATFINAAHDEEVVMGGSTTALMFNFIQSLLPSIRAGDELVVTNTEHEANVGAWKRLAAATGAVVRVWCVNPTTLHLELDDLDALLASGRVKWVAMTHASNVLGTVNPVTEVAMRVRAAGGRLSVDAVAYAPHRLVDVQASGADVYVFSFYKVFGPHYAVMWGRRDLLLSLASLNHECIQADNIPYKLQPGNVNYELSYGCTGIVDYLAHVGGAVLGGRDDATLRARLQHAFDRFEQHENVLAETLLAFLRSRSSVRVIGMPHLRAQHGGRDYTRVATISFVADGAQSPDVVRSLDAVRIGVRFGDFYAVQLVDALDLRKYGGVIRVSLAHYNSLDEVKLLVSHLDKLLP
ncbi:Aste57867_10060 [Aphanomyces stellatus]|uniref:Aste57867_10060 protein n=1 Tax=Aphanomyces stellatus TaxID=120398 RepID=A0A485KPF1_9STRA|nr:hypothetical protein As57867_010021 [Aphanomyces stellatus]VFT86936.1 Aste57867_10060 [Aphanomyces stellatus]